MLQNRETGGDSGGGDKQNLNPFSLTVNSNVACIELLLWAIRDESGKGQGHASRSRSVAYPSLWLSPRKNSKIIKYPYNEMISQIMAVSRFPLL